MLENKISERVLLIGTDYKPGNGGISMLLKGYSTFFETFNFIRSTGPGTKVYKFYLFLQSLLLLVLVCLFQRKIRIIHIHTSSFTFLKREKWYVLIGKFFEKKVIIHLHGGFFEKVCVDHSEELKTIFQKADAIVCVSKYLEEIVKKYNLSDNTYVVYCYIDSPQTVEEYQGEHEKVNLTFLGLINENKGIFDVLKMLGENKAIFQGKIQFYVAGSGDLSTFDKLIEMYQLSDIVKYVGFVKGMSKYKLLQATDIYIQPSYFESFGISILEAMSYGASVISTNVGGIPEIVTSDVGFLISPGDITSMKHVLSLLVRDKNKRCLCADAARKVSKQFYRANTEKSLRDLYVTLL